MNYKDVIKQLNLIPLPEEGGYFRETYRSQKSVQSEIGLRKECTAIYYLISPESFSGLHWVDQEEIFHFYAGEPVEMFQIDKDGNGKKIIIGNNIFNGQNPQVVVPRGTWQGTRLFNSHENSWALLGCTVAPGFELENFHIQDRAWLISKYPHLSEDIKRFTNKKLKSF
jgi:predicted cupin superfamily sugar epimerase